VRGSTANGRGWPIRQLGARCVVWMLVSELTVVAWTVAGSRHVVWMDKQSWNRFAVLAAAATLYIVASRLAEERRRAADLAEPEHVDQTSVYLFAGALLLPVPWAMALLVVVRAQRYLVARKPPSRFIFTTASIGLSVLGVNAVSRLTPLGQWLKSPSLAVGTATTVGILASGVAAIVVYYLAQAVVVPGARVLVAGGNGWAELVYRNEQGKLVSPALGSWDTQLEIFRALGLAVAATLATMPLYGGLLLFVVTPLVIGDTRRQHRLQQTESERDDFRAGMYTDGLTKLPNRESFDLDAGKALDADRAHRRPTTIAVLDIDHFKQINDDYGHAAGDDVLRALGRLLRPVALDDPRGHDILRHGDIIARAGGEEFWLLLPGTSAEHALSVLERVREAVQGTTVKTTRKAGGGRVTLSRTVSIGVCESTPGASLHDLLVMADAALYQSKCSGRNRVTTYGATTKSLGLRAVTDHHTASSRPA
jgi:diguanylate cyclase (GGDEF)-like protein